MTAEQKIYLGKITQDLTQRQAKELAVVAVEQRTTAAGDHGRAVYADAELVRAQFEIIAQAYFTAVRDLDDVVEAEPAQIVEHSTRCDLRDQDPRLRVEQFLE